MSDESKKRRKELGTARDMLKDKQAPEFLDYLLIAILDELESLRWRLDTLEGDE